MKVHNKESLKEIRRQLRQSTTPAEKVLWEKLRNGKLLGLKFKRQHSIGNYIVDFFCSGARLIIELDGPVHLEKEQNEKDKARDENMKEMGFKVLRFSNDEVLSNFGKVQAGIETIIKEDLTLPSPFSRRGK